MSVDYYACAVCGESLYEEFVGYCEKCGRNLCMDCLVKTEKFQWDKRNPYIIPDVRNKTGDIKKKHCPYCSGEKIADEDMVKFLLGKLGITYDQAAEMFKEKK